MSRCRRDLVLRELYIANFYLNRKEYGASLQRLMNVRSSPEFKGLSAKATYKLGNAEQAKEMLNATVENPDAKKYHEKAKGILKNLSLFISLLLLRVIFL